MKLLRRKPALLLLVGLCFLLGPSALADVVHLTNGSKMEGKIVSVQKVDGEPEAGSSGVRIEFEVNLVLEGFRPGRIVRIRPQSWPKVKPPVEETIRSVEDRWPSAEIFRK